MSLAKYLWNLEICISKEPTVCGNLLSYLVLVKLVQTDSTL
jgi:hypothetical protein